MWLQPLELVGTLCTLRPLTRAHHLGLVASVQDGELWKLWYTTVPEPDLVLKEIDRRCDMQEQGSMLPFTIFDKNDTIVGATTFCHAKPAHRRVEIGHTWLGKSQHGSGINVDAKFILLQHAFETLTCNAVVFLTHFCNAQSRHAIERLGAKLDGILRHHRVLANNTLRDTCIYSILRSEWPTVSALLQGRRDKILTRHTDR